MFVTFLQGLAGSGSEMLAELALEFGVDREARDSWYQRAIDIASKWGYTGMVDFLREDLR